MAGKLLYEVIKCELRTIGGVFERLQLNGVGGPIAF